METVDKYFSYYIYTLHFYLWNKLLITWGKPVDLLKVINSSNLYNCYTQVMHRMLSTYTQFSVDKCAKVRLSKQLTS